MQIRSVGPLSVGKIFGLIYVVMGLLFGLSFAMFTVIGGAIAANKQGAAAGVPPVAVGIAAIFLLPAFYGIVGFIGGVITAALYNVAASLVGGIEIDLGR